NKTEVPLSRKESIIEALAGFYAKSSLYEETKSELDRFSKDRNKRSLFRKEISYVTPFGHQFTVITWRSFQSLVDHPQTWIAQ
ncbi:Hypothetical predicted protein, partial [Marmota monax]